MASEETPGGPGAALRRARRRLRTRISLSPALYLPLCRLSGKTHIVRRDTEFVLEGYPRCGNSFAEAAFRVAQPRPVRMAHHSHAAAQVIAAATWGIPTVVVFRDPVDAAVSLVGIWSGHASPRDMVREYVLFYRAVRAHRDRVVLASFESVTADAGEFIRRTNAKFGTDFGIFSNTEDAVAEAFALVDELTRQRIGHALQAYSPLQDEAFKKARAERHARIRERIEAPAMANLVAEARAIHRDMVEGADC